MDGRASFTLYTIGHSNHSIEDFLALLKKHAITDLVDIRSTPQSRFSPHFNKKRLESTLPEHGMTYHFRGEALGGRPKDPSVYVGDKADFALVMQQEWYQAGIQDLFTLLQQIEAKAGRVAIMCSEGDPDQCHRHHLIARSLLDPQVKIVGDEVSVEMVHILKDGELRSISADDFGESRQLPLL
ncbi:MAG: DUF488 domain-containing protein [Chloroflexi bacterium]|nr:DUF488 domain-containing protein [Chloroflexota bacterium]